MFWNHSRLKKKEKETVLCVHHGVKRLDLNQIFSFDDQNTALVCCMDDKNLQCGNKTEFAHHSTVRVF